MSARSKTVVFVLTVGWLVCAGGCRRQQDEPAPGDAAPSTALTASQSELLDIAFAAASAMPLNPHIKNRSRAQEVVVMASLTLDQSRRAQRYIEQIANWRRGAGYANLAFHQAQQGRIDQVESYLQKAIATLDQAEGWRKDRIKGKVAATRACLRRTLETPEPNVPMGEWGRLAQARAMTCTPEDFDEQMAILDKLVAREDFDVVKGALAGYGVLYSRFYANSEQRGLIKEKIEAAWTQMPVFVKMELLLDLADAALDHGDQGGALHLVEEAKTLMDSVPWRPDAALPFMAALAQRRFQAGDQAGGQAEVKAALELFEAKRETIVNIYRAGMLRPLAETYHAMGEVQTALDLYQQAIEAGLENPNSRPRADDLVATCCSMALHAVEPEEALIQRIREVQDGLGDPW